MKFRGLGKSGLKYIWVLLAKLPGIIIALVLITGVNSNFSFALDQNIKISQLNENPEPILPDENATGEQLPGKMKEMPKAVDNKPANEVSPPNSEEVTYPKILRDLSNLPFPVRRMRELILEATLIGDIEKLRPLIGYGDDVTMLSLGGIEEDPLNFLKSLSGDEAGHEILAILSEVLESGYVLMDEGSENELYVWPYFFAWPLDKLTPSQKVELYRLVTYGDYEDMESFGAYIFYRLGITPRGRWRFFVAGD